MKSELSETDRLGDKIAEVAGHLNAATHQLLAPIRRFDERRGWAEQGALSCARWLSWRIGLDPGAAREKVRVAGALGRLPAIDGALRRGEVSYSQVLAMTRVATPENESELLGIARASTAGQLAVVHDVDAAGQPVCPRCSVDASNRAPLLTRRSLPRSGPGIALLSLEP